MSSCCLVEPRRPRFDVAASQSPAKRVTLYELGISEANLASAEMKAGKLTSYFYKRHLSEALEHLEEASAILAQEPPTSNERRWHTRAVDTVAMVRLDLAKEEGAGEAVAPAHAQERNVKAP